MIEELVPGHDEDLEVELGQQSFVLQVVHDRFISHLLHTRLVHLIGVISGLARSGLIFLDTVRCSRLRCRHCSLASLRSELGSLGLLHILRLQASVVLHVLVAEPEHVDVLHLEVHTAEE